MNRKIALAYGIAGLAVAVALVVVIGSTAGLLGGPPAEGAARSGPAPSALTSAALPPAAAGTPAASSTAPAALADTPEVVYVDAPAVRGGDDDDDRHRGGGRDHEERDNE